MYNIYVRTKSYDNSFENLYNVNRDSRRGNNGQLLLWLTVYKINKIIFSIFLGFNFQLVYTLII